MVTYKSVQCIEGLRDSVWLKILYRLVQGTPGDRDVRCGWRLVGDEG